MIPRNAPFFEFRQTIVALPLKGVIEPDKLPVWKHGRNLPFRFAMWTLYYASHRCMPFVLCIRIVALLPKNIKVPYQKLVTVQQQAPMTNHTNKFAY